MMTSRLSSSLARLFSGCCWLVMVVCELPVLQAEIVVREPVRFTVELPQQPQTNHPFIKSFAGGIVGCGE